MSKRKAKASDDLQNTLLETTSAKEFIESLKKIDGFQQFDELIPVNTDISEVNYTNEKWRTDMLKVRILSEI